MATHSLTLPHARRMRNVATLMAFGGLLWIAIFLLIIFNGFATGSLPSSDVPALPVHMRTGLRLFVLSVPMINVGLILLWLQLLRRSLKLSILAALFITIAIVLSTINTLTLSGLFGDARFNDTFMGLSVFATSLATGLLGAAALRTQLLPRRVAQLMIFVGLTTIPVLLGTPLPVGPDWATDYLAFLTSGIAFVAIGALLRRVDQPVS